MLPDEVRQDHNQDKEDSTTVIIWQPVIVDGDPGNIITYSITGELVVPSTTSTNTTVTLPALNTNYTFCVADDATNICGARSDAQKCATPPVIIEAEGTLHHSMHACTLFFQLSELHISLLLTAQ